MRRAFVLLLLITAAYRFSLLDRGTSAFVDETLYFTSVMALQSLAAGDAQAAAYHVTQARGRQGAAILQLPIAAIQAIPAARGVPASNPRSLLVPTTFNVLASLATLFFLYGTARALSGDPLAALVAATVHAFLLNTNLYVRHVLPYELALAFGAAAIWLLTTRPRTSRRVIGAGALTATAVTCYSGYYLLAAAIGLALGLQVWWAAGLRRAASAGFQFVMAAAVVFLAVEVVCRFGGTGYFESSRALGGTITMGAFEEGWTFLPEYLLRVEGIAGILLLTGFAVWSWAFARRLLRQDVRDVDWWLLAGAAIWAVQALLSAELHRIVFYGRLIHPWMFFLAVSLAYSLSLVTPLKSRLAAGVAVIAASFLSLVPAALTYRTLAYPSDVLYSLGIETSGVPESQKLCEFDPGTPYESPAPLDRDTRAPYSAETDFVLANFCQQFTTGRRAVPLDVGGRPLLFDGRHWLTYPAYTFEGFHPRAREALMREPYRVRVYGPAP